MNLCALVLVLLPQEAAQQEEKPEPKPLNEEMVWQILDDPKAVPAKLKEAGTEDPGKIVEVLRRGRPGPISPTGETKVRITDAFATETDLWIVAPRKLDPAKTVGVILMLHGLNGTGAQFKELYRGFADQHHYVIAAPSAQKEPATALNEDNPGNLDERRYPHWWSYRDGSIPLTTLSTLKKLYNVDENRVVISGYSMGGFGAWNIGLRYPDRFCAVISYAGGISRAEYLRGVDKKMRRVFLNAFNLPLYFIHGDADKTVPVGFDRESRNQLRELGYTDHVYVEVPKEDHILNLREGGVLLSGVQKWLAGKTRRAHPKEVRHHAIGDYCPQSYWVRIAEFGEESAEVRASIKDQTIDFTSTGARKITFYIDETHLKLDDPIKVTSEGKKLFEGKIEPSMDVVFESWRAREDRELLFRAKVTVEVK